MTGISNTAALRAIAGLSLLLLCEACGITIHSAPVPQRASAAAPGQNLAPIQLDRVLFNLERGQIIGAYRGGASYNLCIRPGDDRIYWTQGNLTVRDEELNSTFYRELRAANYNVVGAPDVLFADYGNGEKGPELLVGARIDGLKLDVCDQVSPWYEKKLGVQKGAANIAVTWQVFSTLEQKVVYETRSEGAAELAEGVPDGEIALILNAFGNAARNLAGDPGFHNVLLRKDMAMPAATSAPLADRGGQPAQSVLAIAQTPPFSTPIAMNMARIQASVVTVLSGTAQGSGFFVAPDLVLTNHHVARDAARLKLRLINGEEVYATTLRSNAKRDVALLKVEGGPFSPLPLRLSPVALTDEVFAVGSPLDASLAGTVTRGIVSQLQQDEFGLPLIQADATIQPGSSGGPLLDALGNFVGLSQSAVMDSTEHSVGINFFIPIGDALRHLNIASQ